VRASCGPGRCGTTPRSGSPPPTATAPHAATRSRPRSGRGVPHPLADLIVPRFQRLAHLRLAVADGPQRQPAAQQFPGHLLHRTPRAVHERRQVAQRRREPRAAGALADRRRDRLGRALAAGGAGAGVTPVLRHHHRTRRQLVHLVPRPQRRRLLIQRRTAVATGPGQVIDHLVHLIRRQQLAVMTLMPLLPAGLVAGGLPGLELGGPQRVGGGCGGTVGTVGPQPVLQLGHALLHLPQPPLQLGTPRAAVPSLGQRLVHNPATKTRPRRFRGTERLLVITLTDTVQ